LLDTLTPEPSLLLKGIQGKQIGNAAKPSKPQSKGHGFSKAAFAKA